MFNIKPGLKEQEIPDNQTWEELTRITVASSGSGNLINHTSINPLPDDKF